MSLISFDAETLLIKDSNRIENYKSQFKNFFIPKSEDYTFDQENLDNKLYIKSAEKIGYHLPIEVAICEEDPQKNDESDFRVHLRIIDGRHRWKQALDQQIEWPVKFYEIKDYNQFMTLRGHFDSKKQTNVNEKITYFRHLAQYYNETLGIPKPQVCAHIVKDYSPSPFPDWTVRRYLDNEYKDQSKTLAGEIGRANRYRDIETIPNLQKMKPEAIRNKIAVLDHSRKTLDEENKYLRSQLGTDSFKDEFFVLEVLKTNNWVYQKATQDGKSIIKELNQLDPELYRIRKVTQKYEIIYPEKLSDHKKYERLFKFGFRKKDQTTKEASG